MAFVTPWPVTALLGMSTHSNTLPSQHHCQHGLTDVITDRLAGANWAIALGQLAAHAGTI